MDDLRYPIGPFRYAGDGGPTRREQQFDGLAAAPGQLRAAVAGLSPMQLDAPYRRPADFARKFRHPEHGRMFGLDEALAMYAWHGKHHVAHITALRRRMGWD